MFDIGWTELMVVGVVALIVIGPKDLPDMFRTMGRFTAKARSMARDFQRAMEAAADEAGVKDIAKDLKNVTSPRSMGLDAVKNAASKFEKWDPMKPAPKPAAPAPVVTAAAPVVAAEAKPAVPMGPATQALADAHSHVLVKARVVAEAAEKQLEAFRFDDGFARRIVDHQMCEIGLAGDRAQAGKLRRGKAHQIERVGTGIGNIVQHGRFRRCRQRTGLA